MHPYRHVRLLFAAFGLAWSLILSPVRAEFESYDSENLSDIEVILYNSQAILEDIWNEQLLMFDFASGLSESVWSHQLDVMRNLTNLQDRANFLLQSVTNYLSIISTNSGGGGLSPSDITMLSNMLYGIYGELNYSSSDYYGPEGNEWMFKLGLLIQSLLNS